MDHTAQKLIELVKSRDQFGQAGRRCSVPIDSDSDSDRQEFYSTYGRFEYMSKDLVKNAIF